MYAVANDELAVQALHKRKSNRRARPEGASGRADRSPRLRQWRARGLVLDSSTRNLRRVGKVQSARTFRRGIGLVGGLLFPRQALPGSGRHSRPAQMCGRLRGFPGSQGDRGLPGRTWSTAVHVHGIARGVRRCRLSGGHSTGTAPNGDALHRPCVITARAHPAEPATSLFEPPHRRARGRTPTDPDS